MKDNNEQIKFCLQASIDQYADILCLMESITQPVNKTSVEEDIFRGKQIISKQQTARKTDDNLLYLLRISSEEITGSTLFLKRTELLTKVIRQNALVADKFSSIGLFVNSELQQIKKGHSAMQGYRQAGKQYGGNLLVMLS